LERSASAATAREALDEVERLMPRASKNSDRVGLGLAKAQALGFLGRDPESCSVLRSIENSSRSTGYAKDITRLLSLSCQ
jgi:hypothetical protein